MAGIPMKIIQLAFISMLFLVFAHGAIAASNPPPNGCEGGVCLLPETGTHSCWAIADFYNGSRCWAEIDVFGVKTNYLTSINGNTIVNDTAIETSDVIAGRSMAVSSSAFTALLAVSSNPSGNAILASNPSATGYAAHLYGRARVYGGNLLVNQGRVGINYDSPTTALDVWGTSTYLPTIKLTSSTAGYVPTFTAHAATAGVGTDVLVITSEVEGWDPGGYKPARIRFNTQSWSAPSNFGNIIFEVQSGGSGMLQEKMRITPTGLGIGVTNPAYALHVQGTIRSNTDICTSTKCLNSVSSGSGTVNTVAKFATATTVGNSKITDDGATIVLTGNVVVDLCTNPPCEQQIKQE